MDDFDYLLIRGASHRRPSVSRALSAEPQSLFDSPQHLPQNTSSNSQPDPLGIRDGPQPTASSGDVDMEDVQELSAASSTDPPGTLNRRFVQLPTPRPEDDTPMENSDQSIPSSQEPNIDVVGEEAENLARQADDSISVTNIPFSRASISRSIPHDSSTNVTKKPSPGLSPAPSPEVTASRDTLTEILMKRLANMSGQPVRAKDAKSGEKPAPATQSKPIGMDDAVKHDGDDAWMHGADDQENESVKELATLEARKVLLMQKAESNLSDIQIIELMRLTDKIKNMKRRNRGPVVDNSHDEAMFVRDNESERSIFSDQEEAEEEGEEKAEEKAEEEDTANIQGKVIAPHAQAHDDFTDLSLTLAAEIAPKSAPKSASKPRRKPAKNAREVEERREEKRREDEKKKKQRQMDKARSEKAKQTATNRVTKKKPAGKGKGKGKGKERSPKKDVSKASKSRMTNNISAGDSLKDILKNLIQNDPIADRVDQPDYGDTPQINATDKGTQLAMILASVPKDYDTHKAKYERKELLEASKRFGQGQVKAVDGMWLMKGMNTSLYHHQLLAADWMVGRELSSARPNGGLCADGMGLGKTVQMLATMIGNPPLPEDARKNVKSTLIVVPASLANQWREEIHRHVESRRFPRIHRYKASAGTELPVLQECSIVITTYSEVLNSFPYPKKEEQSDMDELAMANWIKGHADEQGPLHEINWYRVVLDEAQAIKNFKSRTSIACLALKSQYRWALTGTPILNNLAELYPYFRFLKSDLSTDLKSFKKNFTGLNREDCQARIQVALSIFMIRRTMKDKLFGRPIVDLPMTNPSTLFIDFSKEESLLYRLIENRFREQMNQHFKAGTAQRNYSVWMVQLLRLRQATAHPFLLEYLIKDIFTAEDMDDIRREFRKFGKDQTPIYEQIEQWVRVPQPAEGMESAPFGRSDFGKHFKMQNYFDSLNIDPAELCERMICRLCGDHVKNARQIECGHIFCKDCIEGYMHRRAAEDLDYQECPHCHKIFHSAKPYQIKNPMDDEDLSSEGCDAYDDTWSGGKDNNSNEPKTNPSTWLNLYDREPETHTLVPSAKSIAIKSQLVKWFDQSPKDKVIIFVQFRLMAKILGRMCNAEKWRFIYYSGDMKQSARSDAVETFHSDNNVKVMIAGLKCGGQGLNLTCANRVISVDLWWNHSVEQQAFGRVFRIGQKKETYLTRLVVKNTVDVRMLDMQADKVRLIDQAMQDTGEGIAPLSLGELAKLFGYVKADENGIPQVYADYDEAADPQD